MNREERLFTQGHRKMKLKEVSGIMLTLLLTGMLALTVNIQQTHSLEAPPIEWSKTYGGTSYERAYSIVQTSDGGYALAGYTKSYGAGGSDFWLVKTDSAGNKLWSKTFGGTDDDSARSVVQTSDGGYAVAGLYHDTSFWLVKTDSIGNKLWEKNYGGGEGGVLRYGSNN